MADPDLRLGSVDIEDGRSADCLERCVLTLRDDADLTTLLGESDRVIPATDDEEPEVVLLAVEVIGSGSTQRSAVEEGIRTVEIAPLMSPSAYAEADPLYMSTVRDRAVSVLRDGIGPGWVYVGSTDDISFREPRTSDDINALVQYLGRVQFRVDLARDDGAP